MKRQPLRPLPSLDRDWSHWAIFGDDQRLDVVPESEVAHALRVIESNRDRYEAVFVYRARLSGTPEELKSKKEGAGRSPIGNNSAGALPIFIFYHDAAPHRVRVARVIESEM